jgi:hypothetical protein
MKKKTVKKLVLSKETVRELTTGLERAVGATVVGLCPSWGCSADDTCGCLSAGQVCDAQETAHPTCIA